MSDYTTVFEISRNSNGILADTLFRVLIGIGALSAGIFSIVRTAKGSNWSVKAVVGPVVMCGWGLMWILAHYSMIVLSTSTLSSLLAIQRNGMADVVEGRVLVEHTQPRTGHTSGDRISIDGKSFEVNYFLVTPGYNKTIAHGGALKNGVRARLHYHDDVILKVEVEK